MNNIDQNTELEKLDNKSEKLDKLDELDISILNILMDDATIPYTEIAKRLQVSGGTIHVRMRKMIVGGIVKGSYLTVNPQKVGYDVCAFLGIYLEKGSQYKQAVEKLGEVREIVEMHYCTGSYSIFAKIICRDTTHLREILNEKIQVIEGIQRTETFMSLEESIRRQINLSN